MDGTSQTKFSFLSTSLFDHLSNVTTYSSLLTGVRWEHCKNIVCTPRPIICTWALLSTRWTANGEIMLQICAVEDNIKYPSNIYLDKLRCVTSKPQALTIWNMAPPYPLAWCELANIQNNTRSYLIQLAWWEMAPTRCDVWAPICERSWQAGIEKFKKKDYSLSWILQETSNSHGWMLPKLNINAKLEQCM